MLKKWTERIVRGTIVLGLLLVLLDLGLHVISHTEWFRTRVTDAIQNALGREIKLARMGANLRGIFIEDFAVAEQGGFENGTFVEAGQLRVRISLLHLLHGHTKIQLVLLSDVTVKTTVFEDGHTSWQDLIPAPSDATEEEPEQTGKFPFRVTATHLRLENMHLIYEDKTAPNTLEIKGLTVGVDRFGLNRNFSFYINATVRPTVRGNPLELPLVLHGKANLQELNMEQAWVELEALSIAYQESSALLKGRVENFKNPKVKLRAIVHNLSAQGLSNLADLPPFELGKVTLFLEGVAHLEEDAFTISTFTLDAPGVDWRVQGNILYGKPKGAEYSFSTQAELRLGEAGRWFTPLAEPYRLVGTAKTQAQVTHQQISGELELVDSGGLVAQAGNFSAVSARVTFQEQTDFKHGAADMDLKGKLNGRPLMFHVQVDQHPDLLTLVTDLQAQEIVLSPVVAQETQPAAPQEPEQSKTSSAWPLPPVRLQAKVTVDKLDIPYFYGENVLFKADMQGLTPGFKQAHGTLQLTTGNGKIQDLYKLTNANSLTKVLFLSLDVVGKVFNSLNVLGVLNSLGSGIVSAVSGSEKEAEVVHTQTVLGPEGEAIEVPVVQTDKNVEGELAYDKFNMAVTFEHGVATVKKGSFVSPTMSLRLDGKTDFNTEKVNLKVRAAPGRHEVDGMMPLTLTIGGTIDNPQGDMALLGSLTSMVTQSVTNNVVSRQLGKGLKGIVNLFKDTPQEQAEPEPAASQPQEAPTEEPVTPALVE